MKFLSSLLPIFESLGALGILAAGSGYFISQFRTGSSEQKKDMISSADQVTSFWKEQAEGFKAMAEKEKENSTIKDAEWNKKFTELSREVGEINGKLVEKEKQANMYLDIINNRDSGTLDFQKVMIQAAKEQSEVNKEVSRVLGEIHAFVSTQSLKVVSTVTKE